MSAESYIERKSVEYAFKTHDSIGLKLTFKRGLPDRQFLYRGRSLFVEFKKPKGVDRELQEWWCNTLADKGFAAIPRIDSVADFKMIFDFWVRQVDEQMEKTS
jgi:hypothetical protein